MKDEGRTVADVGQRREEEHWREEGGRREGGRE